MQQLFIATTNQGKQKEITALLSQSGTQLLFPQDIPATSTISVDETGSTFAENALLKATQFGAIVQMPTLADDSGLIITALGNFPGVHSNRWFSGSDTERNQALLNKMDGLNDRTAQFITVLCLYEPTTAHAMYVTGRVNGRIARQEQGPPESGFGYDPLFIPDGFDHSFAELGPELKNKLSHRGRALQQLKTIIYT